MSAQMWLQSWHARSTNPDFDILSVEEEIQAAGMVEMQVTDDDLLNVLHFVPGGLDGGVQLVSGLVPNSGEDVGQLGTPDLARQLGQSTSRKNFTYVGDLTVG